MYWTHVKMAHIGHHNGKHWSIFDGGVFAASNSSDLQGCVMDLACNYLARLIDQKNLTCTLREEQEISAKTCNKGPIKQQFRFTYWIQKILDYQGIQIRKNEILNICTMNNKENKMQKHALGEIISLKETATCQRKKKRQENFKTMKDLIQRSG